MNHFPVLFKTENTLEQSESLIIGQLQKHRRKHANYCLRVSDYRPFQRQEDMQIVSESLTIDTFQRHHQRHANVI